jgi:predicted GNAT family N-acyltransferase
MTVHDRRTTRSAQALMGAPKPVKFGLEAPRLANLSQRLAVFSATFRDIETLLPRARRAIGGGASNEVVHRVARHNPDSVWAIAHRDRYANGEAVAEGFVALLMLTEEGADQLLSGELDTTNPPLHLLTRQNEKPAAIYCWGIYAPGAIAGGIPLVVEKASTPLYRDAPILARTVTIEGLRIAQTVGFRPGAKFRGKTAPNFHIYPRGPSVKETRAIYDDFLDLEQDQDVSITVVRSIEDFMRVVAVRSATFVAEQDCPYEEEFDGNDFSASHLLAYVGKEPVGCLRIRYFAGFAKLERLAVRHEFRSRHIGTRLMKAGVEFCRAKGYRRIYGRAQKDLLNYYVNMGWKQLEGSSEFYFSDYAYIEIVIDTDPSPNAIALGVDPYVLMRPEGRWDRPGVLDRSAQRGSGQAGQVAAGNRVAAGKKKS